jgi:L-fucose isomerase-like protein
MTPLRIGFVAVVRPAFKGDGAAVAGRARGALAALAPGQGADLIGDEGAVRDATEAAAAGRRLAALGLDLLVVQHATFATGDLLAPLLAAAPRVVLWAVPEAAGARAGGPDGATGPLPLNSLCGLNMTLSFAEGPLGGARGPVGWCYGDADDPVLLTRLADLIAAERGARALATARVLAIGGTAPGFYGLDLIAPPLGAEVVERTLADLFDRVAAVDAEAAEAHALAWRADEPLDAPWDHLVRASRIDLALTAMARECGANALAVRCWPELPDACGAMACAAMGRAADRRLPAACEGDVWGALSMRVLQEVADAPAALLDLSDLDRGRDALLLWHCGNAPRALAAAPGTRLTTHFNRDGVGVVRDQTLAPGPATAFRLLPAPDGKVGSVVIGGRVLEALTPSFDGVRGWWGELTWSRERVSAERAVASILDHRLPHHLALAGGDARGALLELCERLGSTPLPPSPREGLA